VSGTDGWVAVTLDVVEPGDRVRLASGVELQVTRVDRPFFGRDDMLKLVEETDVSWRAYASPVGAEAQVRKASQTRSA
jgi:hypothetical protein